MIWPSQAHVQMIYDLTKSSTCTRSTPNQSIRQHCFQPTFVHTPRWRMLLLDKATSAVQARGVRKTRYGCIHQVLPCSTFTHGRSGLGSIGVTNESGHFVRSISTAWFWVKQGTSTLVPVGNVYVDDVEGNRSCASMLVGQESATVSFLFPDLGFLDTKGSCENIHARAASAPSGLELGLWLAWPSYITQDKTYIHTQPGIQWIRRQGQGQDLSKDKTEIRNIRTKVLGVIRSVYYVPSSTT